MLTRRELLVLGARAGAATALLPASCVWRDPEPAGTWVNDIHSQLNRTRVLRIDRPGNLGALQDLMRGARRDGRAVSIMAGRHAMGGQQFGSDTILIDANGFQGIQEFDAAAGEVEIGAGTQWPHLIGELDERQQGEERAWGIVQKQTGADRLSIGGALSANAHGRGLRFRPMIQDVVAFTLVDARGEAIRCSRDENAELFRLAIGGYGLFGVIASVRLRLARRRKVERVVELIDVADAARRFKERIAEGYLYGDCQFSTDPDAGTLLRRGVFSCYRPAPADATTTEGGKVLATDDWLQLIALAHVDRTEAFARYSSYYIKTSGQVYWTDTHQVSEYIDDYHRVLGGRIGPLSEGTEMITEVYVPRDALAQFMEQVRADILEHDMNLIYGTVRLIERDDESFLAWAKEPWACVIFNLHTAHDLESLAVTARHFRRLIDRARAYGGSYFLTYHRWATREQVLACYPQFPEFLALKRKYDPEERFQSEWYRHYREMFGPST